MYVYKCTQIDVHRHTLPVLNLRARWQARGLVLTSTLTTSTRSRMASTEVPWLGRVGSWFYRLYKGPTRVLKGFRVRGWFQVLGFVMV